MKKTIVVVGAGKGLGNGVAEKFIMKTRTRRDYRTRDEKDMKKMGDF